MNGEIEQMSRIVCCVRKALYTNNDIVFTPSKYVLSIKFVFSSPFYRQFRLCITALQATRAQGKAHTPEDARV